jgi:hypothetical protein
MSMISDRFWPIAGYRVSPRSRPRDFRNLIFNVANDGQMERISLPRIPLAEMLGSFGRGYFISVTTE